MAGGPVKGFETGGAALLRPGERDYERAVATDNLFYRFSRPLYVVQPRNAGQVQAIVNEARAQKLRVTIKNGGHSYAGSSTSDGGILLDLSRLNKVKLDMSKSQTPEFATLEGGARWGHVYKELVNGRHDGYIINGGRCPTVGVSGFILGGGLSPFTRSFGMGCDTLVEATIVTANGEMVRVKDSDRKDSKKGKLFWALCGAGGGNFGVVVELKMKVQRLSGNKVVGGRLTWFPKPNADAMGKFMDTMRKFYTARWPDRTTIDSTWICDLDQTQNEVGVRFLVYHNGDKADFDKTIDKYIKDNDELAKLMRSRAMAEKSSRFLHETLVEQWSEEITMALPSSDRSYRIYTSFVLENNERTITAVTQLIRKEMAAFKKKFPGEKGLLQVTWIHSGGEAKKKKADATAFPWRSCTYHTYIMLQWRDKWLRNDMKRFLSRMEKEIRPFSIDGRAAFINFPDKELPRGAYEAAYYGGNREELQRVKQIWDKDNFFSWSQGVRQPTKTTGVTGTGKARNMAMLPAGLDVEVMDGMAPPPGAAVDMEAEESQDEGSATVDAAEAEESEWDRVGVPLKNDFEGGIHSLADLGF
jgi:hypothetical protein